jgi:mannose-6-phosphate isomerase-like protein (cupin superfamily)
MEPLLILEVQSGDVLDEADIERLDDRYGRG